MTQPTIMMIGGGIQQIDAVKSAQRCGYKVLVTDRSLSSPCFEYADYSATIDGRDVEGLIAFAALHKAQYTISGIFTLTEMVTSVAAVAAALGLPGVPLLSAVNCQNKQLSKEHWLKNNISTPQGEVVHSRDEAVRFFHKLGTNAILKPVVGFGGKGITKVSAEADLDLHDFNRGGALMESCIEGSMHDVNAVFNADGTFVPLGCFDRFFDEHNPVETGAVYPSALSAEQMRQAYALTEQAARSLGITWGPVKSDLVLSEQGFLILEIAPRLHGPKGSLHLTSMVDEQNHLERIFGLLTDPGAKVTAVNPSNMVASYEIIDHPGRPFSKMNGLDQLAQDGFKPLLLNPSSSLYRYSNNTEVIGYIFGKGAEIGQLKENLRNAKKRIHFD